MAFDDFRAQVIAARGDVDRVIRVSQRADQMVAVYSELARLAEESLKVLDSVPILDFPINAEAARKYVRELALKREGVEWFRKLLPEMQAAKEKANLEYASAQKKVEESSAAFKVAAQAEFGDEAAKSYATTKLKEIMQRG